MPAVPSLKFKRTTYPRGKRFYHAALFWVGPHAVATSGKFLGKRLSYIKSVTAQEIVETLKLAGISEYDIPGIERLVAEVAYFVLNRIREDVRSGNLPHMERIEPLRQLTITKKERHFGIAEETPFFESGQFLDSLVVERPRARHGGPNVAGFSVHVDTSVSEDAWHRPNYPRGEPIPMANLYNILTRTGALIDLSSESVRRRIFGFYRALGLLDDKEYEEFLREERTTKGGSVARKRWIYIPPRPLFTDEYIKYLSELANEQIVKPRFQHAMRVAGRAFQYGPRLIRSKEAFLQAKWKAHMSFQQQMELE